MSDEWTVFSPSGIVSIETCPGCDLPSVEVEEGYKAIYHMATGGITDTDTPQRYWHCDNCGDSIVTYSLEEEPTR